MVDGPAECLFANAEEMEDLAATQPELTAPLRTRILGFPQRCAALASWFSSGGVAAPPT